MIKTCKFNDRSQKIKEEINFINIKIIFGIVINGLGYYEGI